MALTQAELDAAQAQINAARDQAHTNIDLAEGWAQVAQSAAEASGSASAQVATAEANRAAQQKALAETARTGAETARTGVETARTGAETAQGLAEDARDRAEDARDRAEDARDRAEAVPTTSDTLMAAILADPDSDTRAVGNATYGTKAEVQEALETARIGSGPQSLDLRWFLGQTARAATSPVDVVVVSDSTGEGAGATVAAERWPDRVLRGLRAEYQPDGIRGGAGYIPVAYSPGALPQRWAHTMNDWAAQVADTFNRTGDVYGSLPEIGPTAWGGTSGVVTAGPTGATFNGAARITATTGSAVTERRVSYRATTPPAFDSATRRSGLVVSQNGSNFLELRGDVSGLVSNWYLQVTIAGQGATTLASFTTPPIPVGAGNTLVNATVTRSGLNVTATVNGQTITATLTEAQATAITGGITAVELWNGGTLHEFTASAPVTATVAKPVLTWGLGLRATYVGNTAECKKASLTFTGTSVDLLFTGRPGTGVATLTLNGGTAQTFTTTRATTTSGLVHRVTAPERGTHTLTLESDSYVIAEGAMVYDGDETAGVRLWEGCRYGALASDFSGTKYNWEKSLAAAVVPDLAIVGIGLNDYKVGTAPATFKTQVETIIARIRAANPSCSILLHNSFLRPDVPSPAHPWSAYLDVFAQIAEADDAVALVDLDAYMKGYSLVPPALHNLWTSDQVHPSSAGYGVMAQRILASVR